MPRFGDSRLTVFDESNGGFDIGSLSRPPSRASAALRRALEANRVTQRSREVQRQRTHPDRSPAFGDGRVFPIPSANNAVVMQSRRVRSARRHPDRSPSFSTGSSFGAALAQASVPDEVSDALRESLTSKPALDPATKTKGLSTTAKAGIGALGLVGVLWLASRAG